MSRLPLFGIAIQPSIRARASCSAGIGSQRPTLWARAISEAMRASNASWLRRYRSRAPSAKRNQSCAKISSASSPRTFVSRISSRPGARMDMRVFEAGRASQWTRIAREAQQLRHRRATATSASSSRALTHRGRSRARCAPPKRASRWSSKAPRGRSRISGQKAHISGTGNSYLLGRK